MASDLARARVERMRGGGPSAWQATTVGMTLAGCVVGGFLVGWWLDERLGTSYWTPVIGLFGVAAGFREVLVTVQRLGKTQERERAEREQERRDARDTQRVLGYGASPRNVNAPHENEERGATHNSSGNGNDAPARPAQVERIWKIPPPPRPGHERTGEAGENVSHDARAVDEVVHDEAVMEQARAEPADVEPADLEDETSTARLIERLLNQDPKHRNEGTDQPQ
ncbi:MAG TPA: AtpZ/AtpI family protein [Abditibacteriaceae bacterium]